MSKMIILIKKFAIFKLSVTRLTTNALGANRTHNMMTLNIISRQAIELFLCHAEGSTMRFILDVYGYGWQLS